MRVADAYARRLQILRDSLLNWWLQVEPKRLRYHLQCFLANARVLIDKPNQRIGSMNDVSEIYATFLGAALLVLLLLRLAEPLGTTIGAQIRRFFVKHVCYPLLICRRQGTTHLTRLECACLLLYFAANVSCLSLRIPSRQALSSRAGTLFALNATVLYDGGRTNFVVDKCLRVRRAQHELFHRWIGRTAAIEGCIHGIIQLTTSSPDPSHRLRVPVRLSSLIHALR